MSDSHVTHLDDHRRYLVDATSASNSMNAAYGSGLVIDASTLLESQRSRPLKVLVVDGDAAHNRRLKKVLAMHGVQTAICTSLEAATEYLSNSSPQLAFIALDVNCSSGLDLLGHPALEKCGEILLMHDDDDREQVGDGIAKGATYFFCKPFSERFVSELLHDLVDAAGMLDEQSEAWVRPRPLDQFGELRGSSSKMRRLFRVIRKVAPAEASILLIGESGTGKDLAASTIHRLSGRAEGPFVAINCAAIPRELFESELFGHEKGSFSGATRHHIGLFERAHKGTLFLDEITEMPLVHQVKLLRVLESGAFTRVGGETELSTDVRIIAATNRNPDEAIANELLREDLYYRIAHFPIWMPPLREREGDIDGLAQLFLDQINEVSGTHKVFSRAALDALRTYSFPGNVRELQSIVKRAHVVASRVIEPSALPTLPSDVSIEQDTIKIPVGSSIEVAERKLILATLERHGGDKPTAAKTLGISLKTLYNRLNSYADRQPHGVN